VVFQPRPQLLGAHPVDARGTGVLLDASERLGEVRAGQELLPQARLSGVRGGVARRRGWAALWAEVFGLHRRTLPPRPPCGVGCVKRPSREHERPAPRLRVRSFPAISDPAGNTTSADFSTANRGLSATVVPSHPASTPSVTAHPGTPAKTSASKTSNLHRTPTAFTEPPLDDIGLRLAVQTRPSRPASYAQHAEDPDAPWVPRVTTSHSGLLPTQPHDRAVAIGLWLVPSTSTGDSHPRAAGHVARTPDVRGLS
jgi:hypothetical protein